MRSENLGYDKNGQHSKIFTAYESRFLGILWDHATGKDRRMPADSLAARFFYAAPLDPDGVLQPSIELPKGGVAEAIHKIGETELDQVKRQVRTLQNHIIVKHDLPVLSQAGPGGGYWMAETEKEAAAFYATFRRRAMTGLVKAARGKKGVMLDIFRQITFDDLTDLTGGDPDGGASPPWQPEPMDVVVSFLDKMTANPEKFSGDLEKLRGRYGGVLMPREKIEQLRAQAAGLTDLLKGIG